MRAAGVGHVPERMTAQLERLFGYKFAPGYNPGLRFMGHLHEPLQATPRPALFYLTTEIIGRLGRLVLRTWKFEQHQKK